MAQKEYPNGGGSHKADRRPDRPKVETKAIPGLTTKHVGTPKTTLFENGNHAKPAQLKDARGVVNGISITPTTAVPLTPIYENPHGGGRGNQGGGTSEKSLRKAKKDAAKKGKGK